MHLYRLETKAFTLIEIIVVIVIIGLTTGFAVPGMISFINNQKANSAALRLSSAYRQARSIAIDQNQTVNVCAIDGTSAAPTSACTTDIATCPCVATTDWIAWKVYSTKLGNIKFYAGVNSGTILANGAAAPSFNSMGIPSSIQTFTIKPLGCTGNNARIVTVNISGYVEVENSSC